jgi:hypothetical protein
MIAKFCIVPNCKLIRTVLKEKNSQTHTHTPHYQNAAQCILYDNSERPIRFPKEGIADEYVEMSNVECRTPPRLNIYGILYK